MKTSKMKEVLLVLGMIPMLYHGASQAASPEIQALQQQMNLLKKQLQKLQKELDRQKRLQQAGKQPRKTQVTSAGNGRGTATSAASSRPVKPYSSDTHVAINGYATVGYADRNKDNGAFSTVKFNPIFKYMYRNLLMVEGEVEFELEGKETEAKLEYATFDLFLNDNFVLLAGKYLSPIGQFRQNLHPDWINKFASKPLGFGNFGAAPGSDIGVQLRGAHNLNGVQVSYAAFVGNGPELKASGGRVQGVDSSGFSEDADGSKVYGLRVSVIPRPRMQFGVSAATGKATVTSNNGTAITGDPDRDYDVFGVDFKVSLDRFDLRGEYVYQKVSDKVGSVAVIGGKWVAGYVQLSYLFPSARWEAVLRYSDYDSPVVSQSQTQWGLGINYLFAPNIVAKLGYEINDGQQGTSADENRVLLQLSYGF